MNTVVIFNSRFGDIRAIYDGKNPLFIANDVAVALGYDDISKAIKEHCKGVTKYRFIKDDQNRKMSVRVLEKADFYRLVFNSKLKSATKYQNSIFEEILKNNCELIKSIGYDVSENKREINFISRVGQ
jgi:prophage antirepressor-like protein